MVVSGEFKMYICETQTRGSNTPPVNIHFGTYKLSTVADVALSLCKTSKQHDHGLVMVKHDLN